MFFLDPFHYRLTTIFNAVMVYLVSYVYCMSCLLPDALYNFFMVLLFHVKLNFGEPWAYLVNSFLCSHSVHPVLSLYVCLHI